jgi:hypothetical protein
LDRLRCGSFDLVFRRQGKIGLLLGLLVFLFSLLDRLFGIGCAGLDRVCRFGAGDEFLPTKQKAGENSRRIRKGNSGEQAQKKVRTV